MQTSWPRPGLVGVQEPRISFRPAAAEDYSGAAEVFELAEGAGRRLPPWQAGAITDGTARRVDGKWAAFEVCLLASRQNGKNGVLELVLLWWMTTEPGVQILYTAHQFKTALKTMRKVMALINKSDQLRRQLMPGQPRTSNGQESITLSNGSTIYFATRTDQGGRGDSVDRLVIDEAMICSPEALAALMPLITTAANGQVWYLGSAADADSQPKCGVWAMLRERALKRTGKRLLWLEWSAPELPATATAAERAAWRMDRRNWAAANPSVGYLFDEEYIEDEVASFAARLEKWEVERLSVGRWPKPPEERERAIPAGTWEDMTELGARVHGPIALALDMTGDLTTAALGAATRTVDDKIRLELGYHGSAQGIVDRVVDLVARWDPCAVVINGSSPAKGALAGQLLARGIEVEFTSAGQAADAAVGLVQDALDGVLSHGGDPRLTDALGSVQKRELGGGRFGWDYTAGDVTRVQVISLARWALLEFGLAPATPAQTPTQDDERDVQVEQDELMSMGF